MKGDVGERHKEGCKNAEIQREKEAKVVLV